MVNMLPKASVEENIVVALARSKEPLTHYQLWKKHKVAASNKTVLTTLSRLEKKHMVNSRQEKKGRKRKFYELTFFGLIACLTYKWAWQLIDEIAEAKKNMLPLVFGKWTFFKKEKLLDEIIGRLKIMSYTWWRNSVSYRIVPETLSRMLHECSLVLFFCFFSVRLWLIIAYLIMFYGFYKVTQEITGNQEITRLY